MLLHVFLFFLLSSSAVVTGVGVARQYHHNDRLQNAVYWPKPVFPHYESLHPYATNRMWSRAYYPGITVSRAPA